MPIFVILYDFDNNLIDKQYFRINGNLNFNEETLDYKTTEIIGNLDIVFEAKKNVGSLTIGLNGLIGFSSRPLLLMSISGFTIALFSFFLGIWYLFQKIAGIDLTPGLTTTVILISFFAGVQLFGLGLVGEYIGRIYDEVKKRPKYIVDKKINFNE